MWDLVKGRCTYTVRLEAEAEAIAFCGADRYALLCGALVTLHGLEGEGGVLASLAHPRRALCMAWVTGGRLVTGAEDGSLRLWDTQVRSSCGLGWAGLGSTASARCPRLHLACMPTCRLHQPAKGPR